MTKRLTETCPPASEGLRLEFVPGSSQTYKDIKMTGETISLTKEPKPSGLKTINVPEKVKDANKIRATTCSWIRSHDLFVSLNRSPGDCLQLTEPLCIAELQPQSLLALKWQSSPNTLMLNAILIKHSNSFFTEINKMVLTFIGKCRRHRVAKQP